MTLLRLSGGNERQDAEIQLQGEPLKRVKTFTYLGSTLAEDGELDAEVTECRAGGRTGRECLECCAIGE